MSLNRLKTIKPMIDNAPPRTTAMKHLQVNRKKKEQEFQRFSAIERENYRLLDSMSQIMVRGAADSVFGAPTQQTFIVDGTKVRENKARRVVQENQVLLRRILETKAYYKKTEFLKHQDKTETLMSQMCKYPNQVFVERHASQKKEKIGFRQSVSADVSTLSATSMTPSGPKARLGTSAGAKAEGTQKRAHTSHGRTGGGGGGGRGGAVSAPLPERGEEEQPSERCQRAEEGSEMGSEAAAYDNDFEEIKDEDIKDEKSRGPPEEKYAEDFEEEGGEEGA